jgi:hypothetical protein
MTDNTQSADIIQRLDWMNLRFAAESQSDATTRRHQTIVDARQEILRLRQPTQSDALAERKLPQDVIDFIEQTTLLATNHGGWFDPHGFKAISPLCDKGNALLRKYCRENGEQS